MFCCLCSHFRHGDMLAHCGGQLQNEDVVVSALCRQQVIGAYVPTSTSQTVATGFPAQFILLRLFSRSYSFAALCRSISCKSGYSRSYKVLRGVRIFRPGDLRRRSHNFDYVFVTDSIKLKSSAAIRLKSTWDEERSANTRACSTGGGVEITQLDAVVAGGLVVGGLGYLLRVLWDKGSVVPSVVRVQRKPFEIKYKRSRPS